MRSAESIMNDYNSSTILNARLQLEVALDTRELLIEIKDVLNECKEELQEIKDNTAGGG